MRSRLVIRPLQAADRPQWDGLWNGYLNFYEAALPAAVSDATFARLIAVSEPIHGLVAEPDGRIVGIAHYLLHRSTWATVIATSKTCSPRLCCEALESEKR